MKLQQANSEHAVTDVPEFSLGSFIDTHLAVYERKWAKGTLALKQLFSGSSGGWPLISLNFPVTDSGVSCFAIEYDRIGDCDEKELAVLSVMSHTTHCVCSLFLLM